MSLSIGIIGLANVGKSTLFNALVKGHQAKVADYPFTTIEPNVGMVEVPDSRLWHIADRLSLKKIIPATIKFIDIAGLVKNAHKGEGLGNQFLGHIREVDAIVHIIDAFSKDSDLPLRQGFGGRAEEAKEIVNLELELAEIKKPLFYILNVKENDIKKSQISNSKSQNNENTIYISAKMEEELTDLADDEAKEYLKYYGLTQSGLVRLIQKSYKLLNLITFYTLKLTNNSQQTTNNPAFAKATAGGQVQAWPILAGTKAPQAAGKVHTDMEKGFISAEVCHYDEFIAYRTWHEAKASGKLRTEGKDYTIQDGDIVHFKFNV